MASNGSFNTSAYEGRLLTFAWTQKSQDVANNKTTIEWTLKGAGGDSTWYMAGAFKLVIDSKTVYTSTTRIQLAKGTTVASGTYTFTHNSDGSRSFTASAEAGIYTHAVNCKGSGSFTLNTIPRASQPSCITWPEHTQNVGNFGDTISIHMNRKSDAFTHTVRYAFGSKSGTIATGVTTGTTWTIPASFMDLMPATTKGSGTIYVDTYNGSTFIGTKYCGFTATVGSGVKPSCRLTLEDLTGVDGIYGSPVQGLSNIKVTVTPTLAYSSPIGAYSVNIDGNYFTATPVASGVLKNAGSSPVTVSVVDERGRSGTASYTMNVQTYAPPNISKLTVHRCNADGTENDQGDYVKALFSAKITALSNKNTAAYKLRYKKSTDSSFTEVTFSDLAGSYTVTDKSYIFAAEDGSSYDVEVVATDRHKTTTRATSASTAFSLMDFHPSGTGLRFGGVAEEEHALQNDLTLIQTGNQYSFSSIGAASTDGYILMARMAITATNSDSPITFVFSRRKAAAPMTVHLLFNATDNTDPGLASIRYEGENFDAYVTSPSASVWDLYVKKVNQSDTITLNRWHTSYRQMNRVAVEFVGSIASAVPTGRHGYYKATPLVSQSILDCFFPVGFILMLYSHADPNTMYPGTTWQRIENAFLWGVDSSGAIGLTGGAKTHTLTVNELPSHSHGSVYSGNVSGTKTHTWLASGGSNMAYGTVATGGGAAHNNMPPYVQVSIWRRTV